MNVPGQPRRSDHNLAGLAHARQRAAEAVRDDAVAHLHRLVDHQDDPCVLDHHGRCQAHFTDGSEPGKCGVAEARAWLAAHDPQPPAETEERD